MPWLPRTGNVPGMVNFGDRTVPSRMAGSQFEPVAGYPQRPAANAHAVVPQPHGMNYANYHASPASPGHASQQAAWQQEMPPRPVEEYAAGYPDQRRRYPAMEELPAPAGPPRDDNQLQVRPNRPAASFYADEFARALPQSATERVIELSTEVASLRQELHEVRDIVERLKAENSELRQMRHQQDLRLSSVEKELANSQQNEAAAQSRFEMLVQRIELFNERRQRQITDLHTIIDQLEDHLRQGDAAPEVNDPSPPVQPAPEQTQTGSNPYRNSSGGLHAHLRSASR